MAKSDQPDVDDDIVEVPIPASVSFLMPHLAEMADELERLQKRAAGGEEVGYAAFAERIRTVRENMAAATLERIKKRRG